MLLLRGATLVVRGLYVRSSFNTCSSCEEQQARASIKGIATSVSIHAPLARSNLDFVSAPAFTPVSIHAPLARSNKNNKQPPQGKEFQYMLLLRGATVFFCCWQYFKVFQYMLLLRGATSSVRLSTRCWLFQYMLLLRGATWTK